MAKLSVTAAVMKTLFYVNDDEHIYIKYDGSLDDGFEIVSHPATLNYHLNDFPWEDILHYAVQMGYRSHQTSTCGLHIHVNRLSLGETHADQEEAISRILYLVEAYWNELLKFSRRTESAMNRWASRYGYESTPKKLMDKGEQLPKPKIETVSYICVQILEKSVK